jgi:hypothetical protein
MAILSLLQITRVDLPHPEQLTIHQAHFLDAITSSLGTTAADVCTN